MVWESQYRLTQPAEDVFVGVFHDPSSPKTWKIEAGILFSNQLCLMEKTMDLIAKTYPCRSQGVAMLNSRGGIHYSQVASCFSADRPRGYVGAQCWLNAETLGRELEAIGEKKMAKRVFETMSSETAAEFGQRLAALAEDFAGRYRDVSPEKRPQISEWVSFYDEESKDYITKPYSTTIDRVVDVIEKASHWYNNVALLGSGVAACF